MSQRLRISRLFFHYRRDGKNSIPVKVVLTHGARGNDFTSIARRMGWECVYTDVIATLHYILESEIEAICGTKPRVVSVTEIIGDDEVKFTFYIEEELY